MSGRKSLTDTHAAIGFRRLRVMNRPRVAVVAALVGLGVLLTACQLPNASGASKSSKPKSDKSVLVPFGSVTTDGEGASDNADGIVSIPDTDPPETTAPEEIEAEAKDTTPPTPATTSAAQNPICKTAKRIVSLNERIDKGLTKAFTYTRAKTLVRALRALPITDLRNAYDDLSAELTVARRRKLAVVRDFIVDVGMGIVNSTSIDKLGETIAKYESDARAERAAINNRSLSKYIKDKCDFALTMVGDSYAKK